MPREVNPMLHVNDWDFPHEDYHCDDPEKKKLVFKLAKMITDSATMLSQVSPIYYLILLVLFVGSLVGVIMMFKANKRGFHIYSIAQIGMLIAASVYIYPLQKPSPFVSDLMLTAIFILLYYLYFKRMEITQSPENQE